MSQPIVDVKVGMNDNGEPFVTEPLDQVQVKAFAEASAAKKTGTPIGGPDKKGGSSKGGKSRRNRKSRGGKSRKGRKSLRRK
jgi:hypothetical protein